MFGRLRRGRRFLAGAMLMGVLAIRAACAEPALLTVRGAHGGTVYVFGTMHVLPARADWFSPRIRAAFAQSDTLWEEADIGLSDPAALVGILLQGVTNDDLFAKLSPPYRAKFRAQLARCGMPAIAVSHMMPWMAMTMTDACAMQGAHPGADVALFSAARKAGKRVGFLETAAQQIAVLSHGTPAAQIAALEHAIDEAGAPDTLRHLEAVWLSGRLDGFAGDLTDMKRHDPDQYRAIFVQRNVGFATRVARMADAGGTNFVAIGAGHLVGPDGVPALLRRWNYTVSDH